MLHTPRNLDAAHVHWLVTALNEHNTSVNRALTHDAFKLLDRQRLKTWRIRFYRQLYRAADLLLTDPHAAEKFAARTPMIH